MQYSEKEELLLHALSKKEGQLERELVRACAEADEIVRRAEEDGERLLAQAEHESLGRAKERAAQRAERVRLRMDKRLEAVGASIDLLEAMTPEALEEMAATIVSDIFPELDRD